jgi:hypothetical protein
MSYPPGCTQADIDRAIQGDPCLECGKEVTLGRLCDECRDEMNDELEAEAYERAMR